MRATEVLDNLPLLFYENMISQSKNVEELAERVMYVPHEKLVQQVYAKKSCNAR